MMSCGSCHGFWTPHLSNSKAVTPAVAPEQASEEALELLGQTTSFWSGLTFGPLTSVTL